MNLKTARNTANMLLSNNLDRLSQGDLKDLLERVERKLGREPAPEPVRRVSRRKKDTVRYLDEDELARLFRVIADPRDLALFELAYHRGLRASEVGLLQLAHLRLAHKRLYVTRLKGGTSGEFLLTDRELKALRAYLKVRGTAAGPLFLSRNNRAISRRRLDELMKRYGAAAGVPPEKQHFHCLRHSCGTQLLEHDVAIEEVQDHLGHTDIRNTMIYAKVTNRKRRAKDERLQQRF